MIHPLTDQSGSPADIFDASRVDPATGEPRVREDVMEAAVAVFNAVAALPPAHADASTLRQALAGLYKQYKKQRRAAAKAKVTAHNDAVMEATATGAADRIDDETKGIPLEAATAESVGQYTKPIPCYICKEDFRDVHPFYHQLCPKCAPFNYGKRTAALDLTGRHALLTGGRAKIGMYIALRLLRAGATLTITTRFPRDAARRFAAEDDSAQWLDRLDIVGLDLRDPAQVVSLGQRMLSKSRLDIIINNAAQTVRRSQDAYAPLAAAERDPLPTGPMPSMVSFDRASDLHPAALTSLDAGTVDTHAPRPASTISGGELSRRATRAGEASLEKHLDGTALDAGGLLPDVVDKNSWTAAVGDVDPREMLEVALCNQAAPFILVNMLRPMLAASPAKRTYIVNVSAMEGVFSRGYKGPGHPHTNMAKAALNMMTRTSAGELFESDGILMTAVDTGWITDERPHTTKIRLAQEGFRAPLDLVDGAARVLDPIVMGEQGHDLYGVFLKDFRKHPW